MDTATQATNQETKRRPLRERSAATMALLMMQVCCILYPGNMGFGSHI